MKSWSYWLKPIMIVLAIFAFVIFLINLDTMSFQSVSWSTINPIVIEIMPWLVALVLVVAVLVYIWGKS